MTVSPFLTDCHSLTSYMRAGAFSLFIFLLIGCDSMTVVPNPSLPQANPLRETHVDFDSGNKISETIFEYNDNGKLVHETFTDSENIARNYETFYEYGTSGYLIKKTIFNSYTQSVEGFLTYFYASDNHIDSVQSYRGKVYESTSLYHYDLLRRLISESYTAHDGYPESSTFQYYYKGNTRVKTCYSGVCTLMDYNEDGQIVKSTLDYGSEINLKRVTEEYSYTNKILSGKILYLYNIYLNTDIYTSRTRVEYTY
jgi:hypothetical protein